MRLYLSSYRNGDHPGALLGLVGRGGRSAEGARVAVIANALDAESADVREAGVAGEFARLGALGLEPAEVDLRDFFGGAADEVGRALAAFPVVWLRGGNVFVLRGALALSSADTALSALLRRDAVVHAGYSAGACVLAPSLRGLEACDDVTAVSRAYGTEPVMRGLGVLDHAVVPHVDSPDHPESAVLGEVAASYRASGTAHVTLRDGQALVVDGDERYVV
jgi:dipeptidase E